LAKKLNHKPAEKRTPHLRSFNMFTNIQDNAIATLDLDPIKVKLMHQQSGEGWTRDHAEAIELEYRRFLFLMKKFPDEVTAPVVDVDTFWHYHILDTMNYAADCERVFGYFLHHFPYYGMRGDEDLTALAVAGDRMQELYEQEFGATQYAGMQEATRQNAFCIKAPQIAFCIKAPGAADGRPIAMPAYSLAALTPEQPAHAAAAFCIKAPAQQPANAEFAFCIKAPAQHTADAELAFCIKSPMQMNRLFSARPGLTSAAV
jgi:hypothetical protein